jgi:formate dehydrogenase subunit gamma
MRVPDAALNEQIRRIAADHVGRPGGVLPALHAVQARLGHVPAEATAILAELFNLSRAEIHGIVGFYHDFRRTPPGRHVVKLCRAEACQSMGGRASEAHAKERLHTDFHATSTDGRYTLEPVYCFGNCACAPAAMIDGKLHGRVTPQRFDQLIDALEAQR